MGELELEVDGIHVCFLYKRDYGVNSGLKERQLRIH